MIVSLPPRDPDLRRALALQRKFNKLQFVKTSSQTAGKIPSGGPGGGSGGSVNGTGTDNHIVRWDGTGNIQDSGWVIADTTNTMSISQASAATALVSATNSSTTDGSIALYGIASGATGATTAVYGASGSSNNAAYAGGFSAGNTSAGGNAAILSIGPIDLTEVAVPADPATGKGRLYAYTDGSLHYINDASTDTDLTAGATNYWSKSGTDVSPATADDDVLLHDGSTLQWGNGNPGTADVVLSRGSANVLKLASGDTLELDTLLGTNGATIDTATGVANTLSLRGYATTGGTRVALLTMTNAALAPTLDFPTGATWNGNEIYHATGTDVPLTDGGTGASTAAGALLNITGWVESFVTSADFTTSSTTLVNITGLTFAAAANKTYEIDALLYIDTSAVTTGVKFGVNYSAAGAAVKALINATSTTSAGSLGTLNTIGGSSANTYLTTSDISGVCYIKGFVTTGANTGNITIQGLKVTSGTLTVFRGSRLMVRELTT